MMSYPENYGLFAFLRIIMNCQGRHSMMDWSLLDILNIISVFLLLFFSFFLIRNKKGRRRSNGILAALLFATALCLLNYVIYKQQEISSTWVFDYLVLGNSIVFLWGPLLYFYIRSIIHPEFSFHIKHGVHLIPFLAYFSYLLIRMAILDERIVRGPLGAGIAFHPLEVLISLGSLHALFLFYIIASFRSLQRFRQQLKNYYSSTKNLEFSWLSILLVSFSMMWTIGFVNSYLAAKKGSPLPVLSFINLALIFFIANMSVYKGLKKPEVFSGFDDRIKYERSTLTRSDADRYLTKLRNLMEEERPYLDPCLNINQLARRLTIQSRHLSQVLNESLHQNFYDFINGYRIEEAKKMLANTSGEKPTVLEVLLDAGFNSKSAFNRAFKKWTGLTPSEFRRQNNP